MHLPNGSKSPPRKRLLAVDDDATVREILECYFSERGYVVKTAEDGESALDEFGARDYDLIILDVNLPGYLSGLDVCREVRQSRGIPIIMLTGDSDEASRVVGLELGADDYVPKPFSPRELEARVRAVLRRASTASPSEPETPKERSRNFEFGDWRLFHDQRELVDSTGSPVSLTSSEYRLLKTFVSHPNRVLSRDQLMNMTKGRDAMPYDRSIDIMVGRLRKKLGDSGRQPKLIKAFRGEGYLFAPAVRRL